MVDKARQQFSLEVTLGGAIAYVPKGKQIWALIPNGLMPTPAQWSKTSSPNYFYARAPHLALMRIETKYIDDVSKGSVDSVLHKYNYKSKKALARNTSTEFAVISLINRVVDFDVAEKQVVIGDDVANFFPHMGKVSPEHSRVAKRFNPDKSNMGNVISELSSVLKIKGGTLDVADYFGKKAPESLDFGYVFSFLGGLHYVDRYHFDKLANKLLWRTPLRGSADSVTVTTTGFKYGSPYTYKLKVPPKETTIKVEIIHSEPDVPLLFRIDPNIPAKVQALPDPDFEMMHSLSTNPDFPGRVPIPEDGRTGGIEKPCTGGMFVEFEP